MIRSAILAGAALLAACGSKAPADGNSAIANAAVEQPANRCVPPQLAMAGGGQSLDSALLGETKANFATAFETACAKQLFKDKALIDPKAADQEHLFLVNAPEANVASIYLSEIDGNRMVLEFPFLTTDGRPNVPSADELEEAIYCAVVGAAPEEQESTGRCLVD